jgi:hypothetical protein
MELRQHHYNPNLWSCYFSTIINYLLLSRVWSLFNCSTIVGKNVSFLESYSRMPTWQTIHSNLSILSTILVNSTIWHGSYKDSIWCVQWVLFAINRNKTLENNSNIYFFHNPQLTKQGNEDTQDTSNLTYTKHVYGPVEIHDDADF